MWSPDCTMLRKATISAACPDAVATAARPFSSAATRSSKTAVVGFESRVQAALFDAVSEMIDRTQLRERLGSLPPEDFENLDGELGAQKITITLRGVGEHLSLGPRPDQRRIPNSTGESAQGAYQITEARTRHFRRKLSVEKSPTRRV